MKHIYARSELIKRLFTGNGIVKTIIFFVQIVMVLFRDSLWPQWWDTVARALRFLNVRVSGIPCVADAFRDDALAFFLQMLFPWALVFVVSVVVLLRHLIVTRCLKRKVVLLLSPHDDANDSDLDGAIRSHGGLSHDGLVWDVQKAPQKSDEALERLRADGQVASTRARAHACGSSLTFCTHQVAADASRTYAAYSHRGVLRGQVARVMWVALPAHVRATRAQVTLS